MATTTNYSWTTPDDTDLVKDGAAAIRTLGSSIDTTTKNLNPQTTTGAIAYRSATSNVNTSLALGTAGQVLTVNSGATAPEWAAPVAGGMTLISTTTLTGASVTLSAIPGTYKNLHIIVRNFRPATDATALYMRFNADATASRHRTIQWSTAGGVATFNEGLAYISQSADNGASTSLIKIDLFDYANTVTWKLANSIAADNDSTTATSINHYRATHFYNQTAAITSLEFLPGSGNFTSGTILLYGVN
jgi:hypothetical protein